MTVYDLERTVNSGLTTTVKISKINFGQLFIEIDIEALYSTILYLKTNDKCRFKQLIDITAVTKDHLVVLVVAQKPVQQGG